MMGVSNTVSWVVWKTSYNENSEGVVRKRLDLQLTNNKINYAQDAMTIVSQ